MSDTLPAAVWLDAMADPVLLIQTDGLILSASGALIRELKLTRSEVVGQKLRNLLLSPWDNAAAYLRRVSGSRQTTVGVMTFRRTDESEFQCRCHGNLLQAGEENSPGLLLLRCRERSQAGSPFLKLNRRLEELTKENADSQRTGAQLQSHNQELETRVRHEIAARELAQERLAQSQRMEALGQLAAGIAHDFNNVLQAISGGLAMIQKRASEPSVQEFSRMAMDAADRGATITGRLLSFARQGELRAQAMDVGQLLTAIHEMLTPVLGVTIVMRVECLDPAPWLYADRGQLETALVNLVINARDAMPNGGSVLIRAASEAVADALTHPGVLAPGRYVRLEIVDTGVGMNAATLAKASEPFFTTKPVGRGTGLGLAMARGFTRQSDGGFSIASVQGHGTTVTLWLPEVSPLASAPGAPTHEHIPPILARAVRVLVVDDDALVREVLASQLEDQGYETIRMSDGLAALAWLEKGEVADLLVTDFAMPGMNGLALIKEVRRRGSTLPALLLTGYADATIQRAVQESNTLLLRKPVRSDELIERTMALLNKD